MTITLSLDRNDDDSYCLTTNGDLKMKMTILILSLMIRHVQTQPTINPVPPQKYEESFFDCTIINRAVLSAESLYYATKLHFSLYLITSVIGNNTDRPTIYPAAYANNCPSIVFPYNKSIQVVNQLFPGFLCIVRFSSIIR